MKDHERHVEEGLTLIACVGMGPYVPVHYSLKSENSGQGELRTEQWQKYFCVALLDLLSRQTSATPIARVVLLETPQVLNQWRLLWNQLTDLRNKIDHGWTSNTAERFNGASINAIALTAESFVPQLSSLIDAVRECGAKLETLR